MGSPIGWSHTCSLHSRSCKWVSDPEILFGAKSCYFQQKTPKQGWKGVWPVTLLVQILDPHLNWFPCVKMEKVTPFNRRKSSKNWSQDNFPFCRGAFCNTRRCDGWKILRICTRYAGFLLSEIETPVSKVEPAGRARRSNTLYIPGLFFFLYFCLLELFCFSIPPYRRSTRL